MTSWTTISIHDSDASASADLLLMCADGRYLSASPGFAASIESAIKRAEFTSTCGQWLDLLGGGEVTRRTLLLGTGRHAGSDAEQWVSVGARVYDAMVALRLKSLRLPEFELPEGEKLLERLLLGALLRGFQLEQGRRQPEAAFRPERLLINKGGSTQARRALDTATAVNRARAWTEQPANLLTPPVWVDEVREAFTKIGIAVHVLETDELERIGAGALVAVGRGSPYGARLLMAEWRGDLARERWDAVLVGKGLTFDAGGLNLKPRPSISKMKFDMAGGAAVLGAVELAALRACPVNVVAIVPMVENVIDGKAFRPGDVIKSLSGLTIEVLDTDAEGRLALADAITYSLQVYSPAWVIDIATLTGAVMAVLHEEFGAVYASDDKLAEELLEAGEAVGERLWRLPLDPSQDYLVESDVADLCNLGKRGFYESAAGSPTAGAKFLERFTSGTRWAHIDMTGAAWSTRTGYRWGKGATGFGVRLFDRWLSILERYRV